jgi:hypothetical protein
MFHAAYAPTECAQKTPQMFIELQVKSHIELVKQELIKMKLKITFFQRTIRVYSSFSTYNSIFKLLKQIKQTRIRGEEGVIMQNESTLLVDNEEKIMPVLWREGFLFSTNSPVCALNVFGIEFARQVLVCELAKVVDIHPKHHGVLADTMCFTGELQSVKSSGVSANQDSIIGKACYEKAFSILLNAAADKKIDKCNDVSTQVAIGSSINRLDDGYHHESETYSPFSKNKNKQSSLQIESATYSPSSAKKQLNQIVYSLFM